MNRKLLHTLVGLFIVAPIGLIGNATARLASGTPTTTTSTVPATTTTTTAPPNHRAVMEVGVSTTTTTTVIPDLTNQAAIDAARTVWGRCGEWHDLAISVGWSEADWPMLSRVLYKESRCNFDSWNRSDPMDGSMGLTQINTFWCLPTQYNPSGWLQKQGALTECSQLFDPTVNLSAALLIYKRSGWGPWGL